MRGKLLSWRRSWGGSKVLTTALWTVASLLVAQEARPPAALNPLPKFLGSASCNASMCHGGGGPEREQFQIWSKLDHHTKARATLVLPRSERFAEALKLGDATKAERCTTCHDPWQNLADALKGPLVKPVDLVSCETCHGAAEPWIRSHTRPDYSHADRVATGLRDLKNLYVRANACVACHQNVDSDLLKAGHPELIFELDGQSVAEPKHWREKRDWVGPQSWLVGQAVALRESSWQLERESALHENLAPRWAGLAWLMQQAAAVEGAAAPPTSSERPTRAAARAMRDWADRFAQDAAAADWSSEKVWKHLTAFAGTQGDFANVATPNAVRARAAERLVLALDRLLLALNGKTALPKSHQRLDELFKEVQALPDFDGAKFAQHLKELQQALVQEKAAPGLRAATP